MLVSILYKETKRRELYKIVIHFKKYMCYNSDYLMSKKSSLLIIELIFTSFLLLDSCSSSDADITSYDEKTTLRYTANTLYEATIWTEEVELDRLTSSISSVPGISSRLNLSPLIVIAGASGDSEKLFPSLASFGSLDTTLISKSLRETLTSFCESLSKNKDADSFMAKDCLFSLALFYSDFNRIFGKCFEKELAPPEKKEKPEEKEKAGEEQKEEEILLFNSFIFGQPFLDGVYYEVPVKFFSPKATLTLSVFCFENSGSWKIDQIQISDWEIFNAEK